MAVLLGCLALSACDVPTQTGTTEVVVEFSRGYDPSAAPVSLTESAVSVSTLPMRMITDRVEGCLEAGATCLRISGVICNDGAARQVSLWAVGYDAAGRGVFWSLVNFLAPRLIMVLLPAESDAEFILYLSWAEDVESIKIVADNSSPSTMTPLGACPSNRSAVPRKS